MREKISPPSIRIPEALQAALRQEASRRGVSVSRIVEEALERELFGEKKIEQRVLASLFFLQEILASSSDHAAEKLERLGDLVSAWESLADGTDATINGMLDPEGIEIAKKRNRELLSAKVKAISQSEFLRRVSASE